MRWLKRIGGALMALVVALGLYAAWYVYRPRPAPQARTLFGGVHYERRIEDQPRPMVIHIVKVDLAEGASVEVSPAIEHPRFQTSARTTTEYLRASGVQLAVNAAFFYPCRSDGAFGFYPQSGDGVNALGHWAFQGRELSAARPDYDALAIDGAGHARIGRPSFDDRFSVSGAPVLVREGRAATPLRAFAKPGRPSPRTAVGVDRSGRLLWIVVVDGRQPRFSEGITLKELADLFVSLGAHAALNLDGGGSSTLVTRTPKGPRTLNTPIHRRHPPGRERPVANHLGVRSAKAN